MHPRHYTVALAKGAAVLPEMRSLLMHWTPGESDKAFLARVQGEDLLGKHTAQRISDLVLRVFRPRLLAGDDRPARWLKRYLDGHGNGELFREMMLVYSARADDLLYDFTVQRFWGLVRQGDLYITLEDALSFFGEAVDKNLLDQAWSEQAQLRVARALLSALEGFGLVRLIGSSRRELVNYRITDASLGYLVHELHFRGITDAEVVEHPDWGLFGLDRTHTLERLEALGPTAGMVVQRAGSVVRITWSYPSMEAYIDAISR